MKKSFVTDFLEKSKTCESLEQLSQLLEKTFEEMGFFRWAYQTQSETFFEESQPVLVHNYPQKWEEYYVGNKCSEVDPVITLGDKLVIPFQWSELYKRHEITKEQEVFIADAHEHGLIDGLAVPICTPQNNKTSMVSLVSDTSEKEVSKLLNHYHDQLIAISFVYHSMAKDFIRTSQIKDVAKVLLTPREKECLLWVAKGKSSWDISRILHISERTVIFHIENAKQKFNTNNRYQLVIKAILSGHIEP